jgi:hypothetical protein
VVLFCFVLVWKILFGIVCKQVNKGKKEKTKKKRNNSPAYLIGPAAQLTDGPNVPRARVCPRRPSSFVAAQSAQSCGSRAFPFPLVADDWTPPVSCGYLLLSWPSRSLHVFHRIKVDFLRIFN